MSNGAIVAGEVAKVLLMMYFQQMREAGLTPEQSELLYIKERQKFLESDPKIIPEV